MKSVVESSGYISPENLASCGPLFEKLPDIFRQLAERKSREAIFPSSNLILRVFRETTLSTVGVVILGAEPYLGGNGNGLAWDCDRNVKIPSCMQTVLNSIREGYGDERLYTGRTYLDHLPGQGVLLLNKALTSVPNKRKAHKQLWADFFNSTVEELSKLDGIVWSLWGKSLHDVQISNPTHIVLKEPNPSPLDGAFDKQVFLNINTALAQMGRPQIQF